MNVESRYGEVFQGQPCGDGRAHDNRGDEGKGRSGGAPSWKNR
jgi:hypothetical protein